MERKTKALGQYQPLFSKIAKRYDLFRGFYRQNFMQYRNNVHVPILLAIIETIVAREAQTLFGTFPFFDFAGTDPKICRKNAVLVSRQFQDTDIYTKAVDFCLSANMYGTGFMRMGWKTVRRREKNRILEVGDLPGQQIERIKDEVVTRFDGPALVVTDILDTWPQPGRKDIEDCMWVMDRYFMDMQEFKMWAAMGVYDKSGAAMVEAMGNPPSSIAGEYTDRHSVYRSSSDWDARSQNKYDAPVQLVDMIGYVPPEFAPDGVPFRIVTVANDAIVVKDRPYDLWHGKLPILHASPMRDPHYFHGIGKIEAAEKMQYLINRFTSQKADITDLAGDNMWLVNTLSGIDDANLYSRPGRVIKVEGPVDETMIRALSPDLRGVSTIIQEVGELMKYSQLGTGSVEDTVMGFPAGGSDRQTKAEFLGRQELSATRLAMELRLIEIAFEKAADQARGLNRQFLKLPKEISMLGEDSQVDPDSGLPIENERSQTVDLADLNPADYRARATGVTQMLGRGVKQQNVGILTDLMQRNPVATQAINWVSWLKYCMRTFDISKPDDFFNQKVPAINMAGGLPGGLGSSGGDGLASFMGAQSMFGGL